MWGIILVTLLSAVQDKPKPTADDLVIQIAKAGKITIYGKVYFDPDKPDFAPLEKLFEYRRQMRKYQEKPGEDLFVKYTLFLDLHPDAAFENVQKVLMCGTKHGGITKIVLMAQKSEEFVRMDLPREVGVVAKEEFPTDIRIVICADGNVREHVYHKRKHAKIQKDAGSCVVVVAESEVGRVVADESKKEDSEANRRVVDKLLEKTKETRDRLIKQGKKTVIILDPDEEVPFRHAVRILAALESKDLWPVEIIGSSRYPRYFATGEDKAPGKGEQKDGKTHFNRGSELMREGKYEAAITEFTKAIELKYRTAYAYGKRGHALYELRNYERAQADLMKAIELAPRSAHLYVFRGNNHMAMGNNEAALSDYQKAIEIAPSYEQKLGGHIKEARRRLKTK